MAAHSPGAGTDDPGPCPPHDIAQAATLLRQGALTARELVEQALDAARRNQRLNALITLTPERARSEAAERDRELGAGIDRGPLHGIPVVHKDLFDTAGTRTTMGSRVFAGRVPDADAAVVTRLHEAGAVCLAKANMNEFAAGVSGRNEFYGDIRNPHDHARSPGGSSGGTAAAIAAGVCAAGTGSDTGGSVRVPAAWTGLVGVRPTRGLVNLRGTFPRAASFDVAGPFGRTASDAAAMLTAMSGPDPLDPRTADEARVDYLAELGGDIDGLRVGFPSDWVRADVDDDVFREVQRAADTFALLGAKVVTVGAHGLDRPQVRAQFLDILAYEFGRVLGPTYDRAADPTRLFGAEVRRDLRRGADVPTARYEQAVARRERYAAKIRAVFQDLDVLLTPTTPSVAPRMDASGDCFERARRFVHPVSYADLPAVSVPCGHGNGGMPVGLQLIGAPRTESLLLNAAAALERGTACPPQSSS